MFSLKSRKQKKDHHGKYMNQDDFLYFKKNHKFSFMSEIKAR